VNQKFRNIITFFLLIAYSFSIGFPIQDYLISSVLDEDTQQEVSANLSEVKTPVLSVFPDLEPELSKTADNFIGFQNKDFKDVFLLTIHAESYTTNKDKQYLSSSKNIYPGLDKATLLYPFHSFL